MTLDPKFIEQILSELYKYIVVGGLVILAGIMLKSLVSTIATNIWAKLISRSKITLPDTQIYVDGNWWKVRSCGFNRVKLARPNKKDNGTIDEEAPEIIMEMPLSTYWKSRVTYR